MIRSSAKRLELGRELRDLMAVRPRQRNPLSEYRSLVMEGSPVAYWPLDDPSGLPQDFSGNARHMSAVSGSPTYGHLSLLGRPYIFYPSTAFHDAAVVSTATTNMYVEMWVYRPAGSANGDLFDHGTTSGGFELEFTAASGAFRGNLPGVGTLGAIGQIFEDSWHYIVAGRGAANWRGYINGIFTSGFGAAAPGAPTGNTRIRGGSSAGIYWAHTAFYESDPLAHEDLIEARYGAMVRWLYQ